MGDKSGVLDLKTEGNVLTGSLSDAEHFAAISDGRVDGKELSWSAKITKPIAHELQVQGHRRSGPHQRLGEAPARQGDVYRHSRLTRGGQSAAERDSAIGSSPVSHALS